MNAKMPDSPIPASVRRSLRATLGTRVTRRRSTKHSPLHAHLSQRPRARLSGLLTKHLTKHLAGVTGTLLSLLLLAAVSPSRLQASDLNALEFRGNVAIVDVVTSSGHYLETRLWVWNYDPSSSPLQPTILTCNGAAGGSLTNCMYPSAFCVTSTHTSYSDIYEPSLVTDRYTCNPTTSRQAGACVDLLARVRTLDSNTYTVYSAGHDRVIQALSLDVTDVGYSSSSSCTSK